MQHPKRRSNRPVLLPAVGVQTDIFPVDTPQQMDTLSRERSDGTLSLATRSYQGGQKMTEHECVLAKQVHALAFLIHLVQQCRSPLLCNAHKPAQMARCAGVSRCFVSLKVFAHTHGRRCHQLIGQLMKP